MARKTLITPRNGRTNAARLALLAARLDIEQRLRARETLSIERYPDPLDNAEQIQAREHTALVVSADTDRLREITDALRRLDSGRWGVCDGCGHPIPAERLAALPWAALCRDCQQQAETAEVKA